MNASSLVVPDFLENRIGGMRNWGGQGALLSFLDVLLYITIDC